MLNKEICKRQFLAKCYDQSLSTCFLQKFQLVHSLLCKINLISIFVSWSIDSRFLQRRDFFVKHFFANSNQFASKTWQNVFINSSKKDTLDWRFVVKTQCEMHVRLSSMNWFVVCFFHLFSSRHFVSKSKFFRCSFFKKSIDFVQMCAMFELLDSRNVAIQQSRCTWKFKWKRVVCWNECASCVEMSSKHKTSHLSSIHFLLITCSRQHRLWISFFFAMFRYQNSHVSDHVNMTLCYCAWCRFALECVNVVAIVLLIWFVEFTIIISNLTFWLTWDKFNNYNDFDFSFFSFLLSHFWSCWRARVCCEFIVVVVVEINWRLQSINYFFFELFHESIVVLLHFVRVKHDVSTNRKSIDFLSISNWFKTIESHAWCRDCVRELRNNLTHRCVSFEFDKRTKCKWYNDKSRNCERDIVTLMIQIKTRICVIVKNKNALARALDVWKNTTISISLRCVVNVIQTRWANCLLMRSRKRFDFAITSSKKNLFFSSNSSCSSFRTKNSFLLSNWLSFASKLIVVFVFSLFVCLSRSFFLFRLSTFRCLLTTLIWFLRLILSNFFLLISVIRSLCVFLSKWWISTLLIRFLWMISSRWLILCFLNQWLRSRLVIVVCWIRNSCISNRQTANVTQWKLICWW